jgi:hypothetical protein
VYTEFLDVIISESDLYTPAGPAAPDTGGVIGLFDGLFDGETLSPSRALQSRTNIQLLTYI